MKKDVERTTQDTHKMSKDEYEERCRLLLESITDGVQITDNEFRYVIVNDALARFVQMPKEKLIGSKMTDLFPGIEETVFFETYMQVMETGEPAIASDEFTFPDGRKAWFEVLAYPYQEGLFVIVTDITERKRMTDALRESEGMLSTFMDSSPDGFLF